MGTLQDFINRAEAFRVARDWKQFHNPKNLAISISIEANELLEHFQWKNMEESRDISEEKRAEIKKEIADIGTYLLYMCEELGIDLVQAMEEKMDISESK